MICERCGASVEIAGYFPGALVRCGCGAEHLVPRVTQSPSRAASVYRRPPASERLAASSDGALTCPRCRSPLAPWDHTPAGERSFGCDGCEGVFLETGALEALRGNRPPARPYDLGRELPPERVSTERYVPCPRCAEVMNRNVFGGHSGVVVDACSAHGVWFDRGELERALNFVAGGGLEAEAGRRVEPRPGREAELKRVAAELSATLLAETTADIRHERRVYRSASWFFFDVLEMLGRGPRRPDPRL